jgi:hypothetical protein
MQDLHRWVLLPRWPASQPLWCWCIFRTRGDSVHSLPKGNVLQQCVPPLSPHARANTVTEQKTKYVTGCETVAPGHRANNSIGATAQVACGKGSYSTGATDACTPCPAGSKCTSSTTEEPTECDPGTFSNTGNGSSCTKCPKGSFNSVRETFLDSPNCLKSDSCRSMALLIAARAARASTLTPLGRPLARRVLAAKVPRRAPRMRRSVPPGTPTASNLATNPRLGLAVSFISSLALLQGPNVHHSRDRQHDRCIRSCPTYSP